MNLRTKIRNKKLSIGTWQSIGHPSISEILSSAGFDWICLDIEHSPMSLDNLSNIIMATQAKGTKSFVRVSKNEEVIIKRVLDIGIDGIIIPSINSKKEAQKALNFCFYPPLGKRGVGLHRAQDYGIGFKNYQNRLNEELIVVVQIENIKAVANIEDILSLDRIDAIIVGPYDLSASMGYPGDYEREDVRKALEKVKKVAKKLNKAIGFHIIEPDYERLKEKISEDYSFLAFSIDFLFLGSKAREEMDKLGEFK